MAVVVGDVLAQPAPERLDWHEVGAVARQGHEFDLQCRGGLAYRLGAVIGRAVPEQDQRLVGPLGPQPVQDSDGVLAVGASVGPEPHLTLVVEVEAVEGELVGQARRMRGHPEALAAPRPAIAKTGILVNVRLIEVDQPISVLLGTGQQILHLRDEGLSPLRVGPAEQLAGLLPRQLQPVQGAADRLAAAGATERLPHPADQASQGPAWRRVGPGERRRRRGVLGGADDRAEAGLDLGAKGGRPPVRRKVSASGPRALYRCSHSITVCGWRWVRAATCVAQLARVTSRAPGSARGCADAPRWWPTDASPPVF